MSTEENNPLILEKPNSMMVNSFHKYGRILLLISAAVPTFLALFVSGIYVSSGGHDFMLDDFGSAWVVLSRDYPHVAEEFIHMQKEILVAYLAIGLLSLAIIYFPFRDGQRWSWFILWLLPTSMLEGTIHEFQVESGFGIVSFSMLLSIIGLMISYQNFFPREPRDTID